VALCGECHTAPATTTAKDSGFVRYQASGLVLSRCYTESGQGLSCTTCHDPHKDVETDAAYYESRCLKCHPATAPSADRTTADPVVTRRSCRINPRSGCLDCHMPRIKNAVPRTVFTDHQIRARRD
jgi:formate-dependent nitrite reductase cytochrome c552 subunit